jgi:hypothetical protein
MVSTLKRRSERNEACELKFEIDFGGPDVEDPDPGPPHPTVTDPPAGIPD